MNIEFDLYLKEHWTNVLHKLDETTNRTFNRIDRYMNKLGEEHRINVNTDGLDRAHEKIKGVTSALEVMKGTMMGELAFRGLERGFDKTKDFVKESILGGMEEGKVERMFQVMAGKEKGSGLFEEINKKYLPTSIYGKEQYQHSADLLSAGEKNTRIVEDLKQIGDIAFGNDEKFQRITYALQSVIEERAFNGIERKMLRGTGFNAEQTLAAADPKHRNTDYWLDQLGKAGTGLEWFRKSMEIATSAGGRFYKGQDEVAKTMWGKAKIMSTNWELMKDAWGKELQPVMERLLDRMKPFIDKVPHLLEELTPKIEHLVDGFIDLLPTLKEFGSGLINILKPIGEAAYPLIKDMLDLGAAILRNPLFQETAKAAGNVLEGAANVIGNEIGIYKNWWNAIFDQDKYNRDNDPHIMTSERKGYMWNSEPLGMNERGLKIDSARMEKVIDSIGRGNFFIDEAAFEEYGRGFMKKYYPKTAWTAMGMDLPLTSINGDKSEKGGKGGAGGAGAGSEGTSDAILGGGQRVFTINMNAPMYKVEHQVFQSIKDAIDDFEPKVQEALWRIMRTLPVGR